ncbi:MAG TPA: (Fe-S)-binding protein [Candidatus Nanopelagicaceae bacterium]|nr:(Fe-S)-binding protein [Candidatus Nanopelagicaceae bacterium]
MQEFFDKYRWFIEELNKVEKEVKRKVIKNISRLKKDFFPEGDYKADIDNLINCALCPNLCRFDCGTLQAAQKESMSPSYKARIGYYLSIGKIDPTKEENKPFIDLMYKCSNEENCKVWCPFEFSVVSLLETVRDDLNDKGLMPEYCKEQIDKLHKSNTIEEYNIYETYKENGIENIESDGNDDVFYYIGCESMKFPEVIKANINILKKAGIKFSTNLDSKVCCGGPSFNIRDLTTAKDFAEKNKSLIESTGAEIIVSDCPGCVLTLTKRYESVGIKIDKKIIHIVEYIKKLLDKGKIEPTKNIQDDLKKVTIHDPCLIARNMNDTSSIRDILGKIPGLELVEPTYNKEYVHCCGWSGTAHWADKDLAIKEATIRVSELKETGANVFISACPLCELGLGYGLTEEEKEKIIIMDVSELLNKVL